MAKRAKKGGSRGLMMLAVGVACAALFPAVATLIAVGLVPTYVAYVLDGRPNRLFTMTIMMPNLMGILPLVFMWMDTDRSFSAATALLTQSDNLLIIVSASGLGWVLAYVVPPVASQWAKAQITLRIKRLKKTTDHIKEIWGEQVADTEGLMIEDQPNGAPDAFGT